MEEMDDFRFRFRFRPLLLCLFFFLVRTVARKANPQEGKGLPQFRTSHDPRQGPGLKKEYHANSDALGSWDQEVSAFIDRLRCALRTPYT